VPEPPHYGSVEVFGPFKRRQSPSQTPDDLRAILASGELWGGVPYGSDRPAVQAIRGPLLPDDVGFKFYAIHPPEHLYGDPRWYVRSDGSIRIEDDVAKMTIVVSRVTMPLR